MVRHRTHAIQSPFECEGEVTLETGLIPHGPLQVEGEDVGERRHAHLLRDHLPRFPHPSTAQHSCRGFLTWARFSRRRAHKLEAAWSRDAG